MTVIDANKALLLYPVVTETSAIVARFILITLTYFIIELVGLSMVALLYLDLQIFLLPPLKPLSLLL